MKELHIRVPLPQFVQHLERIKDDYDLKWVLYNFEFSDEAAIYPAVQQRPGFYGVTMVRNRNGRVK
jgi:hypothetical protein